jgi:ribonuclease VapC
MAAARQREPSWASPSPARPRRRLAAVVASGYRRLVAVVVLDASAFLAYALAEPGGDVVTAIISADDAVISADDAVISAVNVAEVLALLARRGLSTELPPVFRIEPFLEADATATLDLFAPEVVRRFGLSLGDRACLALGARLEASVLTADRVWSDVFPTGSRVEVHLIR